MERLNFPEVSIIIPAYNCENIIENTVSIISTQSFTNLEIIIIDDGSIDLTYTKLKMLSKKEKRLRIIKQDNQGVAGARNAGIKAARGTYIMFVDADDTLDRNMVKHMYNTAVKYKTEVVICGFCVFMQGKKKIEYCLSNHYYGNSQEIHKAFDRIVKSRMLNVVWNKLIERDYLEKWDIFFEDFKSGEDTIFNMRLMEHLSSLFVMEDVLYYYSQMPEGTLTTKFHSDKFKALLRYNLLLQDLYENWGILTEQHQQGLYYMLIRSVISSLMCICTSGCRLSRKEKRAWIREILATGRVKEAVGGLKSDDILVWLLLTSIKSNNITLNHILAHCIFILNKVKPTLVENSKNKM